MRKTNLFYLEGNDTKFLTFSNYGEYLTGVCLSTNHKIWPSSFICLNLPFSNNEITEIETYVPTNDYNAGIGTFDNQSTSQYTHNVHDFKKFLMCYYENKLAYLRDNYDLQNKKQEDIHGDENRLLNYLLEAICLFFNNPQLDIQYFGDIVEHDYNGSYNDSICIVDFNRKKELNIGYVNNDYKCWEITDSLYNWTENELYAYKPITDTNIYPNYYNLENFIQCTISGNPDESQIDKITFNCVIPLFDIIDQNLLENSDIINENTEPNHKYKYIPYGIWFASEKEDGTLNNIELNKQNDNISQTWSLVVCSKFAPYPMGLTINDEFNEVEKTIEQYTYAELLAKHSQLLTNYNELSNNYNDLSNKVSDLLKRVNNIEQLYPENHIRLVDNINDILQCNNIEQNEKIEGLRNKFNDLLEQLKWKAINTYSVNN